MVGYIVSCYQTSLNTFLQISIIIHSLECCLFLKGFLLRNYFTTGYLFKFSYIEIWILVLKLPLAMHINNTLFVVVVLLLEVWNIMLSVGKGLLICKKKEAKYMQFGTTPKHDLSFQSHPSLQVHFSAALKRDCNTNVKNANCPLVYLDGSNNDLRRIAM